jgi:mediator of RNA polymerase II transcription subunit 16
MEVDMDDLFGDGAGLALPARPPPRELFERMDELRASGCCQYVVILSIKTRNSPI